MQKNLYTSIAQYAKDHDTAQALGAALLQCNGMIVPANMPGIALLIPNFQIPTITHNEPADYNTAGGAQFHVAGAPKNRYDLTMQLIETDTGQLTKFSELLMATGGMTDCIAYEGTPGNYLAAHLLRDCAITFDPKDIEGEGVSSIVRVQAQCKSNYYGVNAQLGGTNSVGMLANPSNAQFFQKARQILNTVEAGNSLINTISEVF
jgi:hypothetical protein